MVLRRVEPEDAPRFFDHLQRHFRESGNGNFIFHPVLDFHEWKKEERIQKYPERWSRSLQESDAEVMWVIDDGSEIRGALTLRSSYLKSSRHRATLGLGLESSLRGKGYGRKLMNEAIEWIDLGVFSHNTPAIELYKSLGFAEIGVFRDLFRVNGQSIDDIAMCLDLRKK